MFQRLAVFVGVLAGVVCPPSGSARLLESWPYDRLVKEADLVVIARPVKTEDAADEPPTHNWPFELVGQDTTFEVQQALKGETDGARVKVLHFKFGEPKKGVDPKTAVILNGPLLVAFPLKDGREHLLFLRRLKDGRYEPVSGRIDPRLSVRLLSDPAGEVPATGGLPGSRRPR